MYLGISRLCMTAKTDRAQDFRLTTIMLAGILLLVLIATWLVADLRNQVREKMELQGQLDTFKLPIRYILEVMSHNSWK
jgi:flagellar biogenesis protein FliO